MYANGRIPLSALGSIPGGHLRKDVAAAWNAMRAEALADGVTLMPAGPISSYRPYAAQVAMKAQWTAKGEPYKAATPGSSNHGWGVAVDVKDSVDANSAVYRWLRHNAHRFGFDNVEGQRVGENWHWGYTGHYVPDALAVLREDERRWLREYERLKRANQDRSRRAVLLRVLRERRQGIWHAAQTSGWDRGDRRARYRILHRYS